MRIVIPTHRRVTNQITLRNLPRSLRSCVTLVVSDPSEVRPLGADWGEVDAIMVAKGAKCIADKRHWIMNNVPGEAIFMLDDDLTFYARCSPRHRIFSDGGWVAKAGHTFLMQPTEAQLVEAFALAQRYIMDPEFGAVGIASRMGNNRVEPDVVFNTRLMHAFGVRKDVYKKFGLNFGEVKIREDFNIALHLLKRKLSNALICYVCVNHAAYNASGGASTERTMEQSNAEAEHLARLHPGLVKVVDKNYTSSVPRKEVVVQWKKAFNS